MIYDGRRGASQYQILFWAVASVIFHGKITQTDVAQSVPPNRQNWRSCSFKRECYSPSLFNMRVHRPAVFFSFRLLLECPNLLLSRPWSITDVQSLGRFFPARVLNALCIPVPAHSNVMHKIEVVHTFLLEIMRSKIYIQLRIPIQIIVCGASYIQWEFGKLEKGILSPKNTNERTLYK